MIIKATLRTKFLDGIEVMISGVGKTYLVDLDTIETVTWVNSEYQYEREIRVIREFETGTFLPLKVLSIEGITPPRRN
jgi:hypothetical protein